MNIHKKFMEGLKAEIKKKKLKEAAPLPTLIGRLQKSPVYKREKKNELQARGYAPHWSAPIEKKFKKVFSHTTRKDPLG